MSKRNLNGAKEQRRMDDGVKTRFIFLWVLKSNYQEIIVKQLIERPKQHKMYIQTLKNDGYEVIGYTRKSPGKEKQQKRLDLLELMVNRLTIDSSADKVFGSYSSQASQPFVDRDINQNIRIPSALGNTQDFLKYLTISTKPIAVVAVDFAGLTTNTNDLVDWLQKYRIVEYIIIENLEAKNETHNFTRQQLLSNKSLVNKFNCRPSPVTRSTRSSCS